MPRLAARLSSLGVGSPFLSRRLPQQPIPQRPKAACQRQIPPKSVPTASGVETGRQPLLQLRLWEPIWVMAIDEAQVLRVIGGACVNGSDEAIQKQGKGQNCH